MFIVNPLSAYAMVHQVLAVRPDTLLLQSAAGSALARMVVRMGRLAGFRPMSPDRAGWFRECSKDAGKK